MQARYFNDRVIFHLMQLIRYNLESLYDTNVDASLSVRFYVMKFYMKLYMMKLLIVRDIVGIATITHEHA